VCSWCSCDPSLCSPGSREWKPAPVAMRPEGTKVLDNGIACESPLGPASGTNSDLDDWLPADSLVPLKGAQIELPSGARSSDV
jgi:hypothetical protein